MQTPTHEPDPRLARTRAVVLDAATEVLAQQGTEGFTVDAVVAVCASPVVTPPSA